MASSEDGFFLNVSNDRYDTKREPGAEAGPAERVS